MSKHHCAQDNTISRWQGSGEPPSQGKEKHININKFAGLSRDWDWVGAKTLFMCVFFFQVIPCGGEKTHKQNSPKIRGQSRENFVYVFFLYVFFAPHLHSEEHRAREPRNLTHELSHESAHENAHESVHEDVHENAHEHLRLFLCKAHQRVPTKTPTRVLTGKFPVLTKMYTKVSSVNFHMSYFHMFCFLAIHRVWEP